MTSFTCSAWEILYWVLQIFRFAMFAYALVSWVPSMQGRWSYYVARIVEPVLLPVRRIIPPMGGLDLSFIVLLVVLSVVMNQITAVAYTSSGCYIH